MNSIASTIRNRDKWSDLLSLVSLIPAVIALASGHFFYGLLLWLASTLFAFSIGPHTKPAWWGALFFIPILFVGAVASVVISVVLYLLALVLLPLSLIFER